LPASGQVSARPHPLLEKTMFKTPSEIPSLEATPELLAILLEELDLDSKDLARLCRTSPVTVRRQWLGAGPTPMSVIRMCASLVQVRRDYALTYYNLRNIERNIEERENLLRMQVMEYCDRDRDEPPPAGECPGTGAAIEERIRWRRRRRRRPLPAQAAVPDQQVTQPERVAAPPQVATEQQVPTEVAVPPQVTAPPQVYRRRRVPAQAVVPVEAAVPPQVTVPEPPQVTAPPPPPRPEYRAGLRLISAVLPKDPPPRHDGIGGYHPDSSAPVIRRRRITPPED
jgi:hypothetical protein